MLRGENIVCGTSTTGTGTLTLAATPAAVGALDPFAAFSGLGLGTTNATPMPYIIIEYTDNTYATPSKVEKGFGNLLIGASLAATTLTRNALVTQVSTTYTNGTFSTPATAITIGTATNVLVFIGPCAWDQAQTLHSYATSGIANAGLLGVSPWQSSNLIQTWTGTSGQAVYTAIKIDCSDIIKSVSVRISGALTTPTTSSFTSSLYAITSTGLPGKKLIDFGTNSSNPLGTLGYLTLTSSNPVPIMAGSYIFGFLAIWTGGTGSLGFFAGSGGSCPSPFGIDIGNLAGSITTCTVSAQTVLNDPATTTSLARFGSSSGGQISMAFRNT